MTADSVTPLPKAQLDVPVVALAHDGFCRSQEVTAPAGNAADRPNPANSKLAIFMMTT